MTRTEPTRRKFLAGFGASVGLVIAAPAIVRASSLMKVVVPRGLFGLVQYPPPSSELVGIVTAMQNDLCLVCAGPSFTWCRLPHQGLVIGDAVVMDKNGRLHFVKATNA